MYVCVVNHRVFDAPDIDHLISLLNKLKIDICTYGEYINIKGKLITKNDDNALKKYLAKEYGVIVSDSYKQAALSTTDKTPFIKSAKAFSKLMEELYEEEVFR